MDDNVEFLVAQLPLLDPSLDPFAAYRWREDIEYPCTFSFSFIFDVCRYENQIIIGSDDSLGEHYVSEIVDVPAEFTCL